MPKIKVSLRSIIYIKQPVYNPSTLVRLMDSTFFIQWFVFS